jgi:hypothetical protein
LLQDRSLLNSQKAEEDSEATLFASDSEQPHDLVLVYDTGDRRWELQHFNQEQHADFSASASAPAAGLGQIVFLRGCISPSWLSAIGSKYSIDPEFFRRHMDFLSTSIDRHAYSFPSLASSSNNIFRLCVSTILHRDDFGGQDLQSQRSEQASELGAYKIQQLGSTKVRCGDSQVREYSTVCPRFSVLEQWVSLYITKTDGGWAGKSKPESPATKRTLLTWTRSHRLDGPWQAFGELSSRAVDNSPGTVQGDTATHPPTSPPDGI